MSLIVNSVNEIISQLSPDQEKMLISLPYRVGLYVSYADVTGGWDAQELEGQTLVSILREFSQDFYKTEFAQKILMDTLSSRDQWHSWARDVDNLPAQISEIKDVLMGLMDVEEVTQFHDVLISIGMAVAMAFRENKEDGDEMKLHNPFRIGQLIAKLVGDRKSSNQLSHINISSSEKEAVLRLVQSMDLSGVIVLK